MKMKVSNTELVLACLLHAISVTAARPPETQSSA
jgi:hypothetical protein